jgi:hypothetical protein
MGKRGSGTPRHPRSPVAKAVRTPAFRMRVVPDKRWPKKLKRGEEHHSGCRRSNMTMQPIQAKIDPRVWLLADRCSCWFGPATSRRTLHLVSRSSAGADCLADVAAYRTRFPLTPLAYVLLTLHGVILMIGGHYTYAEMPLFNWLRDTSSFRAITMTVLVTSPRASFRPSSRGKSCCAGRRCSRANGCFS